MSAKLVTIYRTGKVATVQPHEPTGNLALDASKALGLPVDTVVSTLTPGEAGVIVDVAEDLWAVQRMAETLSPDEIRKMWKDLHV